MNLHEKINYIEFPVKSIHRAKKFYSQVFSWTFEDYGDEYTAFSDGVMKGGFFKSPQSASTENGSVLIIFYSEHLEDTLEKVLEAEGEIAQEIFAFPGGRRFHFRDISGNEFAVWTDKEKV